MQLILYSGHALWLMGIAGCVLGIIIGALLPVAFAHLRPQRDPETRLDWPPLDGHPVIRKREILGAWIVAAVAQVIAGLLVHWALMAWWPPH